MQKRTYIAMSWRTVIITGVAKLDYKMEYLVVRKVDSTKRVHLSEIEMLIIESTTVSVTTALLSALTQHKTKVVFCDDKHNPESELIPCYGSYDSSGKVKDQINWDADIKEMIWTEIIAEKIRKQREHLLERKLYDSAELLGQYIREIQPGDITNREGHAAKVYFNALFGKSFTRSSECSINASLNYGYGILLSYFNRNISANGYLTQLGLFHDNRFNPYNLSSDLMEPFRILVDRKVMEMSPVKFDKEEKHELIALMQERVIIDAKSNTISNVVRIYCKSVFDAINDRDVSQIKFYSHEL